jgi:hypothetical protein
MGRGHKLASPMTNMNGTSDSSIALLLHVACTSPFSRRISGTWAREPEYSGVSGHICVLRGEMAPFILRKRGDGYWEFMGKRTFMGLWTVVLSGALGKRT